MHPIMSISCAPLLSGHLLSLLVSITGVDLIAFVSHPLRAANRPVTPLGKRAADAQSASCPNQDSSVINQNITLEALFGKREKYISPDPHAAFIKDPSAWASSLAPVLLPEACREMVYTFQVRTIGMVTSFSSMIIHQVRCHEVAL